MARPCRNRAVDPHSSVTTGCRYCRLSTTDESYARYWAEPWPPSEEYVPPPPPPPPRGPCSFLGVVIEPCLSCGSQESRHVRQCFHDDNPTEKCTLGFVSAAVWACERCPHYTPESKE